MKSYSCKNEMDLEIVNFDHIDCLFDEYPKIRLQYLFVYLFIFYEIWANGLFVSMEIEQRLIWWWIRWWCHFCCSFDSIFFSIEMHFLLKAHAI